MLLPIPGIVVIGEAILSIILEISASISPISIVSARISLIVCFSSRDLAGILEPIEFLAASLILIAVSRS